MRFFRVARLSIVAAGLVLLGLSANAQNPQNPPARSDHQFSANKPPMQRAFGGDRFQGRWWNNPKVIERLKLTDDQRKAFDAILLQHREKLIDLRANVEKAELEMEPLMRDDQPNEGKILAQIDKVAQARAELEKAHARYLLALRSKLTPAQWKQVEEFRRDHGAGPGMPPPPGRGGRDDHMDRMDKPSDSPRP